MANIVGQTIAGVSDKLKFQVGGIGNDFEQFKADRRKKREFMQQMNIYMLLDSVQNSEVIVGVTLPVQN
jgi:hypothetical protein